jgi:hypothetical protein
MGVAIVKALEGPFHGFQPLVLIDLMGGKAAEVPISSMALPARPSYWIIILAQWKQSSSSSGEKEREAAVKWTRDLWSRLVQIDIETNRSEAQNSSYLDHESYEPELLENLTLAMGQQAQVSRMWGENEERMRAVKAFYDPDNVFWSKIPPQSS